MGVASLETDFGAILNADPGAIPGEDSVLEFTACLRDEGLTVDDPDFSGEGHSGAGPFGDAIDTDDPAFQAAAPSCEGIIGS